VEYVIDQLGGRPDLAHDEVEDLAARIDAQRDGRELLARHQLTSAQLATPSGTRTQTFRLSPCGSAQWTRAETGGPHGGAAGGGSAAASPGARTRAQEWPP
jgi:hypothetical protein